MTYQPWFSKYTITVIYQVVMEIMGPKEYFNDKGCIHQNHFQKLITPKFNGFFTKSCFPLPQKFDIVIQTHLGVQIKVLQITQFVLFHGLQAYSAMVQRADGDSLRCVGFVIPLAQSLRNPYRYNSQRIEWTSSPTSLSKKVPNWLALLHEMRLVYLLPFDRCIKKKKIIYILKKPIHIRRISIIKIIVILSSLNEPFFILFKRCLREIFLVYNRV